MSGWRLLLTRPLDECAALAQALAQEGVFGTCMPLLSLEPLVLGAAQRQSLQNLPRYAAAIVVSKPAARLVLPLLPRQRGDTVWFSVGAGTAGVLQAGGLSVTYPETADDSEALLDVAQLRALLARPDPRVLIVRGEGGREVLAQRLREQGATVDYVELYRRLCPPYPPTALPGRIASERLNALVVSSGQGFEHLRQLAGEHWQTLRFMPLFVPSPRVAEMARAAGAENVVDCRGASAAALLTALRERDAPTP